MSAKQKVTLYIPDELHRQFKIRSAVDGETMSLIAQRAIEFYLGNADVVESSAEAHGQSHRIHSCPKCSAQVALREEGLSLIQGHAVHELEELIGLNRLEELPSAARSPEEEELITC